MGAPHISALTLDRPKTARDAYKSIRMQIAINKQAAISKEKESGAHYEQAEHGRRRKKRCHHKGKLKGDKKSKCEGKRLKGVKQSKTGSDGKPLACCRCGSIYHLIGQCPHAADEDVIRYVSDLVTQFEEFGLIVDERSSSESDSGLSDDEGEVDVNYIEPADEFLKGRADMHCMMGDNEALHANQESSFLGA